MAKEGRAWEGAVIYGDVVITGPPQYGEATEVDPAMVDYFSSLELSPNAVADLGRAKRGVARDHLGAGP